jgi:hypothetical protein
MVGDAVVHGWIADVQMTNLPFVHPLGLWTIREPTRSLGQLAPW